MTEVGATGAEATEAGAVADQAAGHPACAQPVPVGLHHRGDRIIADWADIAGTDPTLPFLADRIARAGAVWQADLPEADGAPEPAALILHAGRCGSTLVSRGLSLLSRCHVLSEPQALNMVLSVDGRWPFLPPPDRHRALRQVVAALARAKRPDQDRFILKLSSWNALHLPLLEAAFPAVPKLFIYRQPEEILVSLQDGPAGWMRRAANPAPASLFLGLPPSQVRRSPLAFAAQMLARSMTLVADSVMRQASGNWLLVPYGSLPGALTTEILPWLGLTAEPDEAAALARSAGIDAKDPAGLRPFRPDDGHKRAAVSPEVAELARDLLCTPYERLEGLRLLTGRIER
ncbi:aspartyl/asparaginyl beta-hydroxylase [Azospirillum sp. TSH100]|uniref:aspartyl/asparaginyl beta-hydroxylase n=1 Tax=Azospirillum sp. TSH100 TaxID=652764 RepID=UPI0018EE8D77|nr:aspartyl/asparaginyl beta-hydroxylase [Azospirillum sp. TSH100]